MNLGKNKIAVIGHTRGIGKAICDLYKKKKYEVVGMSKSNGFDIIHDQEKIIENIEDCGLVVLNAHADRGQLNILKRIYGHQFKVWDKFKYVQYCQIKKELIEYINELQQELIFKPLSVYDVCPDVVDTDMTKGLWEDLPKLTAGEVAEAVRYCFESTFNINKIVLQKNAR